MPMPRKVTKDRELEFVAAYSDAKITFAALAERFDVSLRTVYATARRLQLPPRMQALEAAGLPPFGKRERAA